LRAIAKQKEWRAVSDSTTTLDERIALLRRTISDLMEQATAASGSATEESLAARLDDLQQRLNTLLQQRDALGGKTN
jgi:predicted  nucleic acid-binding Zn-ribbon protein